MNALQAAGKWKRRRAPMLLTVGLATAAISVVGAAFESRGAYTSALILLHILGVLLIVSAAVAAIVSGGAAMRTRRKVALGAAASLMAVYALWSTAFWWALGGHYDLIRLKYDDRWIIGRSIAEVEERYGEADLYGDGTYCYILYKDDAAIMPSHLTYRYAMFTDENGVVERIDDHYIRPGG